MKIAIDVDDVLLFQQQDIIDWHNETYGTRNTLDEYSHDWWTTWGCTYDEMLVRAEEYHHAGRIEKYQPLIDAIAVLAELKKTHELYVVTARNGKAVDLTYDWVAEHFPDVFKDLHFARLYDPKNPLTKGMICEELGIDVLIDDSIDNCNSAVDHGCSAILFGGYQWHDKHHTQPYDIVQKATNWHEVAACLPGVTLRGK
jgi:5'(3')-deoxyribonucleotidase